MNNFGAKNKVNLINYFKNAAFGKNILEKFLSTHPGRYWSSKNDDGGIYCLENCVSTGLCEIFNEIFNGQNFVNEFGEWYATAEVRYSGNKATKSKKDFLISHYFNGMVKNKLILFISK